MNPCFFEDRTARQRIAAELVVSRIERNQRLRRLQDQAIHRADRRRLHRALIRNGAIFVIAAVAIFALIWWCGL
jgi:hypothetical protein